MASRTNEKKYGKETEMNTVHVNDIRQSIDSRLNSWEKKALALEAQFNADRATVLPGSKDRSDAPAKHSTEPSRRLLALPIWLKT